MSTQKIKVLSEKYYNKIVEIRHKIHMNPELAFEEYETAKLVANELKSMGIEVKEGIAKTGVVGIIRGKNPGKTILLRADMDALLVDEENDFSYKSRIKGKMHACGHDGHVAGVLGAAMILNDLKDEISGNIKLVFQPAEETYGGAKPMIDEGILKSPDVDAAIGCHLWGSFDEGEIHIKEGPIMAAPDVFTFKIIGQGGHAGLPHLSKDNVLIASQAICNIQSIVSRKVDPLKPLVISCCSIHGGSSHNVMPNEVEVKGTVRTLHKDVRDWAPKAIEDTLKSTTQAYGADYEFEYSKQYPTLVNNEKMVQLARKSISKLIGEENVHKQEQATMGGEDFAYFAEMVPSVYYFIGITPKGKDKVLHHDPSFQYDDKNLLVLSQSMAQIAVDFLNEN